MSSAAEQRVAERFIASAQRLYGERRNESVLIRNLISYLPQMFPNGTAWIAHHVRDAEAQVAYASGAGSRSVFIDSLVGYTTIEYERDLLNSGLFQTGYGQVRQHLAGLLNQGAPEAKILGVLSDTLRWRVYRVAKVTSPASGSLGPNDIELEQVDALDVSASSPGDGERLIDFLARYLGRENARRLAAETVAFDLGFDSEFGKRHLASLEQLVASALNERPDYAAIIQRLWTDFVSYIGDAKSEFDAALYSSELYVVTLSKLLCANVIARRALHSDDRELAAILDGTHFRSKGLENLVEYDYFGWLNAEPYVAAVLPVARQMQRGLRTYDFESPAAEDLFGQLLAQLATRTQRVLLGQEWTPPWLARRIAERLFSELPEDDSPRFIDMCCGSGSMLVEVVRLARARLGAGPLDDSTVQELTRVATGFDIDPLAVMLAKVNWVAASRDWLGPFDGSRRVSIPIYLADSLFAKTPVGEAGNGPGDAYELSLHDRSLALPAHLVSPERRALFDAILDRAYVVGMAAAKTDSPGAIEADDIEVALDSAASAAGVTLSQNDRSETARFLLELAVALEQLQREKLNGIWAFVLRNSYRPGLVLGQFNGLISNPPWLALSKFADNPYRDVLRREAEAYAIPAPGAAHLHAELATTFLLHATDRYLRAGAVIGCVLPETLLNGAQHEPFRRGAYKHAPRPVTLAIDELWRVATGTFKNEALVLLGAKRTAAQPKTIAGQIVGADTSAPISFRLIEHGGGRTAWSDSNAGGETEWFEDLAFRQGADVFPRTAVFHEVTPAGTGQSHLSPIDRSTSRLGYLVDDVKKMSDFAITPTTVPREYFFDVLISKHVLPFDIADPAEAFLPFQRTSDGSWRAASPTRLAATPTAEAAFAEIFDAIGDVEDATVTASTYFDYVDTPRRKLSQQVFPSQGYLVLFGAGGTYVSAAYAPLTRFDTSRLIIDQTLYWAIFSTEEEALYVSGLFNSPALEHTIAEFQPQGQFGRRHIHELPARATPKFDPANPLHVAVVDTTRNIVGELAALRTDPKFASCFDPSGHFVSRRRKLRTQGLPSLPSYAAYVAACAAVYAQHRRP